MSDDSHVHIGTSGWHYDHWSGPFYPADLPQEDYLDYYARSFQTVEINNTFYGLPETETLRTWLEQTPDEFIFSAKASRYITHMKKLKDPQESLSNFLDRIRVMKAKLGPILFQLPPNWHFNLRRLVGFIELLPAENRYTFEFRDPSWFDQRAYEAMAKYNVAFCIYELNGLLSPKEITADFVYVRMHGPEGRYEGKYSTQSLAGWAGAFSSWMNQGKEIYCYFDNDMQGFAVQNALELRSMLIK